ncbi:hypothetical protein Tco_1514594 [Tanacetum coccineum]
MSNNNNNLQTQTSSALHNAIMEVVGKDRPLMLAPVPTDTPTTPNDGTLQQLRQEVMGTYATILAETKKWIDAEAEAVQIILTRIDNDIYSTVDACPNAMEMWKAIERLKQGESINVQDLETNLSSKFRKFTSQEGESLNSYYSRFYKMMNEVTGEYDNQRVVNVARARENVGTQVHNNDDDYNVFANERQHPKQLESVNDTYLVEQGDSLDMSNNGGVADHNDQIVGPSNRA